jgi:hypothetical protein
MDRFIHIRSTRFPILPGEKAELVNEGMYGKALAEYLKGKLTDHGYFSPFVCCEDWGWWVEIRGAPFASGVCIYSSIHDDQLTDFVCAVDPAEDRKWSWHRFRFVDASSWVLRLSTDLVKIFQDDTDIQVVGVYKEFPL